MRKLVEATLVSLDGVVGSPEEWAVPYWDEEYKDYANAQLADVDAFLFGRVTYAKFAAARSKGSVGPHLDAIDSLPKIVASAGMREIFWNATLLTGNVAEGVARLKAQPGRAIMKYGTGRLDRVQISHGLVDEFRFSVLPLVVGSGPRLFEGIDTSGLSLELASTKTFGNGIVQLTYLPRYHSQPRQTRIVQLPLPNQAADHPVPGERILGWPGPVGDRAEGDMIDADWPRRQPRHDRD